MTSEIRHEPPRVIDGSGRTTLGAFVAVTPYGSETFTYPTPEFVDCAEDIAHCEAAARAAYGAAIDFIAQKGCAA